MSNLLKSAQEKLTLKVITLRDSNINFNTDFECDFRDVLPHSFQTFDGVKSCNETEFSPVEEDEEGFYQYKFLFASGIRVLDEDSSPEDSEDEDTQELEIEDEPLVIAEIKAIFEAVYDSNEKLSVEEVQAFGDSNVAFNVWPFWREYVQSSCMRMNIKPISLPFKMASKKSNKE